MKENEENQETQTSQENPADAQVGSNESTTTTTTTEETQETVTSEKVDSTEEEVGEAQGEWEQEAPTFKIPLPESEKIYYENIIAANKKAIKALREQNIALQSELDSLKEG